LETKGSIIVVTSAMGHLRVPLSSDYSSSKFILDRIVEFSALGRGFSAFRLHDYVLILFTHAEYPELRIFGLHPGVIQTALAQEILGEEGTWPFDTVSLPVATMLAISAGKAEWLRGRFEP
jgi:hypothetical protein